MKIYQVGDMINGVFFEGSETEALAAYEEHLAEGFIQEMAHESERCDAGCEPRNETEIREEVKSFYFAQEKI